MVTDNEALKKFCPVAMGSAATEGSFCEGSKCMAWRWTGLSNLANERLGYCGVAGDPSAQAKEWA